MKMKLLMQWDIRPGREGQYFEFIVREFVPAVAQMELQIVDAWYTLYGETSQILIAGVVKDTQTLRQITASKEWEELLGSLFEYAHNFQQKIVPDRGRFQL
jgi:nanoRNase/pAp phosphatase (c-di-AMP/oligoRNAs hydrolase)